MQPRDVRLRRQQFGDDRAILHDIDPVGELQHLVEPMGNEDERGARLQRPHPRKQNVDLRALEHRGRFVEQNHEMAGGVLLERQGLGELHHLARGEAEIVGAHAWIDVHLDLFELTRRGCIEGPPIDEAETRELRLGAQIDVFADRQIGEQRLLLEHHADAFPVGVGGVLETGRFSGDHDLAGVGLIDAAENLHQRGFAGAVLADQSDDLSGSDLDRHGLERVDAGKALVDPDHRKGRLGRARVHLTIRIRSRSIDSATAPMIIRP